MARPMPPNPSSIIAQVAGSGTAATEIASSRIPSFGPPAEFVKLRVSVPPATNVPVKICQSRIRGVGSAVGYSAGETIDQECRTSRCELVRREAIVRVGKGQVIGLTWGEGERLEIPARSALADEIEILVELISQIGTGAASPIEHAVHDVDVTYRYAQPGRLSVGTVLQHGPLITGASKPPLVTWAEAAVEIRPMADAASR